MVDTLAPGIDLAPFYRLDGGREGDEGVSRRAPGHRNRLARRQAHSASDLRHPGRRHGAWLWRLDLLRPAGAAHHRRRARQIPPLHRLDPAPLVGCAARLRDLRRDASARRLSASGRRSQAARPRRLGAGGNGSPDLARDLPHGAGEFLAAPEDPGAQAQGACRADRGGGLARTRSAGARRAALARAQGRSDRRHRRAGADQHREARQSALVAERVRALALGRGYRCRGDRADWPATPRACRYRHAHSPLRTAPRSSSCSRCCCA